MTRINLVPPSELMDQHLFAEFRELKMVPKSLRRSLQAAERRGQSCGHVLSSIPAEYTLGKGHVSFFYDKGLYLQNRYSDLCRELAQRGVNFNANSLLDPDRMFLDARFNKDYLPTGEALRIIRERISQKIALKPEWYRNSGV